MADGNSTPETVEHPYWRRNLAVCLIGSFTTIVAMTLLLPFLPIFVEQLGVTDKAEIAEWSGVAFGSTFLSAALVAPLWGRLADRFGSKAMLMRASLGMTVAMSLIGMADNVWELVAIRVFAGLAGGYSSGSMILVATQTPKARSGWALGMLSSGIMAGNLVGPLVGGALPPLIGIRATFWLAGGIIFLTFIATTTLLKEDRSAATARKASAGGRWSDIPDKRPVIAMLTMGLLLMIAIMSIEPIITLYVQEQVTDRSAVTIVAGFVMSATALGTILSAPRLGRLADRIGHWNVLVVSLLVTAALLIPQAFVTNGWQLIGLRFLMGLALGGLMPCVTAVIRHSVPDRIVGRVLGISTSSQYAGQVTGPLIGGFIGGHIGMRSVFLGTSLLMIGGAIFTWLNRPKARDR